MDVADKGAGGGHRDSAIVNLKTEYAMDSSALHARHRLPPRSRVLQTPMKSRMPKYRRRVKEEHM